jgi:biotin carboxyl carrier protein
VKYVVRIAGQEVEVSVDGTSVRSPDLDGEAHLLDLEGTAIRVVTIGRRVFRVLARRGSVRGQYTLHVNGFRFDVEALDERTRAIRELAGATGKATGPTSLAAPMPGLVVRVLVKPGDRVQSGQGLIVIEAMKMENELRAAAPSIVRTVRVDAGNAVEKGAVLVEFDPAV